MGNHSILDVLSTKYVKYITKCSNIDIRELNLVKQLVYAKIKQEFFSLKYEHIILEDKICELALLIAYTKVAQTQLNVKRNSEFADNNILHSGTMLQSSHQLCLPSDHLQQCAVSPQPQVLEASQHSPQLQHLGIQAVPNQRVHLSPHDIPQGHVEGIQQLPRGL